MSKQKATVGGRDAKDQTKNGKAVLGQLPLTSPKPSQSSVNGTNAPGLPETEMSPAKERDVDSPAQPVIEQSNQTTNAIPERSASIDSILDKPPLTARIRDALARLDRVERLTLCSQLSVPIPEFTAAINEMIEAKEVKEDAIATPSLVYLPLSDIERTEHNEDVAKAKGQEQFLALLRIHDRRTYREDYRSWDDFLHCELGYENPHDWWETEKRRVRIQRLMDENGIKMMIPLKKQMSDHLNKVRNDPDLFVTCLTEFQSLPAARQLAKCLGEIVQRNLDNKKRLSSVRQFAADVTDAEFAALAPIHATDHKWRHWYPEIDRMLQERVQTTGRSPRDCILEIADEIKSLPSEKAILNVARGADLASLVKELMTLQCRWAQDQNRKEEIEEWERKGKKLGIYNPKTKAVTNGVTPMETRQSTEAGERLGSDARPEGRVSNPSQDEGNPVTAAALYQVELTGAFLDWHQKDNFHALSPDDLVSLLTDLADDIEDGIELLNTSTITIRPIVHQE